MTKLFRIAIPAGARTLDETFIIYFDETCVREYIDMNGNPIDINTLSVDDQNALAYCEDDFEDGLNQFDGIYEFRTFFDGSKLRRRAYRCNE